MGAKCYINGQEIDRVASIELHVGTNMVPTFDLEVVGAPDIDMLADVRFSFTPETVEQAVKVLRNELLKHGCVYDGFLECITSALNEIGHSLPNWDTKSISKEILKRIIGED